MINEDLLKVIEQAKAGQEAILDLSNQRLTRLPSELFQLPELTITKGRTDNFITEDQIFSGVVSAP